MRWLLVSAVLVAVVVAVVAQWRQPEPSAPASNVSLADILGPGDADGFAQARGPRAFQFPTDHGPHPGFRQEWWYYTGNLHTAEGRHFGFQLTFFRYALAPAAPARQSRWGTRQAYMAHFALTDVAGERFYSSERLSRGALGLAGAQSEPFRVWLEDWSAQGQQADAVPVRLQVATAEVAVDLQLAQAKPLVLQGVEGWSRKSAEPGNASYYYSYTRLPTRGSIRVDGERLMVTGTSWMDREWSSSALGEEQAGWDWFALQLDDGSEVMYYRLRRQDGGVDPFSAGTVVAADGAVSRLGHDDVVAEPIGYWTSPHSGARYPLRWRLQLPAGQLVVRPLLDDQEQRLSVRYWEGAVRISGQRHGEPVSGYGYLELSGY